MTSPDVAALAAALERLEPATLYGTDGYGYIGQPGRNLAIAILTALTSEELTT